MSSSDRIVRRLRLRAAGESVIHGAALLLEDALRTASLPDASGRIVLVRRLALGRIDRRAAPQTLALDLERAMARLATDCVYAGAGNAGQAPAVWFRDALDAHARLALRLAAGDPAEAWYWPLAVPGWKAGMPLLRSLRRVMFSLAGFPEAPTALPLWVAALAEAGHAGRLIAALRREDVEPLARAAALRIPMLAAADHPGPRPRRGVGAGWRAVPGAEIRHGSRGETVAPPEGGIPVADPRLMLVRSLLRAAKAQGTRVDAQPARSPVAVLHSRYAAERPEHEEIVDHDLRTSGEQACPTAETPNVRFARGKTGRQGRAGGPRPDGLRSQSLHGDTRRAAAGRPERIGRGDGAGDVDAGVTPPLPAREEVGPGSAPAVPGMEPGAATRAGGLLFLIPVLERVGYRDWLEDQPQWARFDLAPRVMALALVRLQVPETDPAWHLATHRGSSRLAPRRFVAPARWRKEPFSRDGGMRAAGQDGTRTLWDASGRLLLGAWSGPCPRGLMRDWRRAAPQAEDARRWDRLERVTDAWLVAARRWLRRAAGIGLADLVLRPAALTLTPTHADLRFEMGSAELRIRRAGLDIDPGWVPWYGRVVTFHYHRSRQT